MNSHIYVLNLPSAKKRLVLMEKALSLYGIGFEVITAVNGKEWIENNKIKPFSSILYKYLSPGEVGCFLSHRESWKRIAGGENDFGVVLEDDAVFGADLKDFLENLESSDLDFDVIHVEQVVKNDGSFLTKRDSQQFIGKFSIHQLCSPSIATGVLIISKQGANKLLELTHAMIEPADEIMFNIYSPLYGKLKVFQTDDVLAWQNFQLSEAIHEQIAPGISKGKVDRKNIGAILHGIIKLAKKVKYLSHVFLLKDKTWIKVNLNCKEKEKLAAEYLKILNETKAC